MKCESLALSRIAIGVLLLNGGGWTYRLGADDSRKYFSFVKSDGIVGLHFGRSYPDDAIALGQSPNFDLQMLKFNLSQSLSLQTYLVQIRRSLENRNSSFRNR
jgi:hypothetical protein